MSTTDFKQALKGRGINGWDAYLCSVRGRNIATAFLDELADVLREFWSTHKDKAYLVVESLVFPRKAAKIASPKRYVREQAPGGRLRMLIQTLTEDGSTWETDGDFILPLPFESQLASAAVGALKTTAAALRGSAAHDGQECVRKKLWGQSKLRRSVTILSSTKVKSVQSSRRIGDRRLNLRTPHK